MNNKDYYNILGVNKNASQDDIKKAFRKVAHQHHPDKAGGNAEKFKEASEAYSTLSDAQKRAQYDRFGSAGPGFAGQGQGNAQGFGGFEGFDFSQFSGFGGQGFGQGDVEFDLGDILGGIFGGGRQRQRQGAHITVDITISFKESVFGTEKPIAYTKSSTRKKESFTVKIPSGIDDGEMLRVTGRGEEVGGGRAGDLYVKIHVQTDNNFRKEGHNLVTVLHIKITEAILGAERTLQTVDGDLTVKVPEGISSGEVLRVRGKGISYGEGAQRGDLLIQIIITIPKKLSKEARKHIEGLKAEGI